MHQNPHCFVRIFAKPQLASTNGHRTLPIIHSIHNPKTAQRLTLVPNQRRLELLQAPLMRELPEGAVIVAPAIEVLSQWVERLCVHICMLRGEPCDRTADAVMLQLLWQEAMPDSSGLSPESEKRLASRLARTADKWLRQWYVDEQPSWLDASFFQARQTVHRNLRQQGLRDAEGWTRFLIEILEQDRPVPLKLPRTLQLEGFHELTRLEQELLAALESRGSMIERTSPGPAKGIARLHGYDDARAELAAAAHWARQQWLAGKQRIAVVINGLESQPQTVRRVFENVFSQSSRITETNSGQDQPFCMPAGEPLLDNAVIESALLLLQLAVGGPRKAIPFNRFSHWMLSPYWAGADHERMARAQLELRLRKDGIFQLLPASLQERAAQAGLENDLELAITHSRAALNCDWRAEDAFYQCLSAWGWPGPLVTGTGNQRAIGRFMKLLEELRSLRLKSPSQALQVLRQMSTDARVNGAGGPLSPVQILSPDDAAGHRFDAAWVANLHEGNWPGSPLSNPYLPFDAASHIPRASHEGELAFRQKLTEALRRLAPEIVFSWGRQAGDLQLAASPLLAEIPLHEQSGRFSAELHDLLFVQPGDGENPDVPASLVKWRHYGEHPWLGVRPDEHGIPLRPAHDGETADAIHGGASAITDQSALPLLSYLRHRLNARFDPVPDAFADAALRGSLLHGALQRLYQPFLGSIERPEPAAIPAAVEAALRERNAFQRLSGLQYEAERLRLIRVLQEWLEKDRQRPSSRIYGLELPLETNLLGHPIRLRADRIDQLDDGCLLIIDYKSSKRATNAWARDRLGEAQLPLYARLLQDNTQDTTQDTGQGTTPDTTPGTARVGGIALATVKHGECLLDGVVNGSAHAFDKLQPLNGKSRALDKRFSDWAAALQSWQQSIDALAEEYIQGDCRNILYNRQHPGLEEFQLLLRHDEGEAWLLHTAADGEEQA